MQRPASIWYQRFRWATLVCSIGSILWTIVLILPFEPFNGLLPVLIDGGAGTWLLLGYLTYVAVGVAGFGGLSALLSTIELQEGRVPNKTGIGLGLVLMFVGVNATCLLLGIAGGYGGYAQNIQHVSAGNLSDLLTPYVDVTRIMAALAALGGLLSVVSIAASKGEKRA